MSKQTLGEFLALLRKANGYTQQDVAEKLNISNRTLSSWETDRTVPDVLMLPAIADLYGVTVDELLRGEKTQPDKEPRAEVSEKAQRGIRKNRFGKFSSKCALISGIAYFCAGLMLLAGILFLFSASPIALDVVLAILGAAGIAVCIGLIFYFANGLKLSEGMVLSEDYTDENKSFALAVKHKCALIFARLSVPFIIFTAIIWIIFSVIKTGNTTVYVEAYLCVIIINALIGFGLLAAYLIYFNRGYKNFADEKQLERHAANKKLFKKLCIIGGIPIFIIWVLSAIFANTYPSTRSVIYQNEDFEKFKSHMQTLVVYETDDFHTVYGAPVGEYELVFPKSADFGTKYELGNGFYGVRGQTQINVYNTKYNFIWFNIWTVYYGETESSAEIYFFEYDIKTDDGYERFVDIRYPGDAETYYHYGFGIHAKSRYDTNYREDEWAYIKSDVDKYAFYSEYVLDISTFTYGLFITATLVAASACTVVYFLKCKKQNYNF